MTQITDRPSHVPWPPIIYVVMAALAVILQAFVPLPWLGIPASDILFVIGILLCAGALALIVVSIRKLIRSGTTVKPHMPSEHLVTAGAFAVTRNPIYLGNTVLMIGAGLAFGMLWLLIFALVAAFATQKLAIEPEEKHLVARFGKRYRDYQKKVRRWI